MRQRLAGLAVVALLAASLISMTNVAGAARASGPDDQLALFDVATGQWTIRHQDGTLSSFFYGNPGDTPLLGDWDCDEVATVGMFRPSNGFVYLRDTNTFGVADREFYYGLGGDIPLVGDWNQDGCDTLSIYRAGKVFVANQLGTVTAEYSFDFGNPGDRPFAGDFDGDGTDSVGLYRDATGFAYFRNSLDSGVAEYSFYYGEPSDRILAGDWDGDGDDSVGIFRPTDGVFYLSYENEQSAADLEVPLMAGNLIPVAGRVDEIPVPTTTTTTTTSTTTTTTTLPPEPFTLMALGDSITEGYTTNQGEYFGNTYRYYLWHDLINAGHQVDFVGSFTATGNGSYGDPNFDQDHQARSGAKTAQLRYESESAIGTLQPDVAIIQIGVNDIWGAPSPPGDPTNSYPYDPPAAMADIAGIIANLRAANPDVIVLLGELLPCYEGVVCTGNQDYGSRIDEMNYHLGLLAGDEDASGSPVALVPLNGQIYSGDLSDGLHPNDVGDQKMATAFFDSLLQLL